MADPLFIVAPGRTFTSIVSAMLGQHPQMYGFPELYLNTSDTMSGWWMATRRGQTILHHGILRSVAQLYAGEQTDATIGEAWNWLRARFQLSTAEVFRELLDKVHPKIGVEKSPFAIHSDENLERLVRFFPNARFIHLTRHPVATCESVLKFDAGSSTMANYAGSYDFSTNPPTLDPQLWWYEWHERIRRFVERLPPEQWRRFQGEEFLSDPDRYLRIVTDWLGLRSDAEAIDEMMHPERSPFSCFGPPSAPYGGDHGFFTNPEFRPFKRRSDNLDAPVAWRQDGCGLLLEARALARVFGYA